MNTIIENNWALINNNLFYKIWTYLYSNWLTVNIKWKIYPNRTWFRQLAMYAWISYEITKESRIDKSNYFIYDYSVRATWKDWRYSECSASCASNEREFNNLENDVRTIAQTRATNRAIADLLWITDITKYIKNNYSSTSQSSPSSLPSQTPTQKETYSEAKSEDSECSEGLEKEQDNSITQKQKDLLRKLIEEIFKDVEEQKAYIEILDELTKQEANFHIKQLLEEKNTMAR
jgi:hypothetical protein